MPCQCDPPPVRERNLFCSVCSKVIDTKALGQVRIMGFVGVQHSTSPKVEAFLNTGDPAHLN